jgi:hypothetical protein
MKGPTWEKRIAHDLAQQDHVFTTDEEQAVPILRKLVTVVYPLVRVFQDKIGWERSKKIKMSTKFSLPRYAQGFGRTELVV